jgi:putative NADH-flavin reductase
MRLAIFGGTGTVGRELLTQALDAGHEIRALVRTPSKLPLEDGRLMVVEGNVKDAAAVKRALVGCEAVLSTLGTSGKDDPDTRRTGTANVMAAMREAGIRRFIVMGGFHLRFPGDRRGVGGMLIGPILRLAYGNALLEDTHGMAAILRASELDWTLVRAPRVTARRRSPAMRTNIRSLGPWSKVSRANVATLMLSCLDDESSIRGAPMICDRRVSA